MQLRLLEGAYSADPSAGQRCDLAQSHDDICTRRFAVRSGRVEHSDGTAHEAHRNTDRRYLAGRAAAQFRARVQLSTGLEHYRVAPPHRGALIGRPHWAPGRTVVRVASAAFQVRSTRVRQQDLARVRAGLFERQAEGVVHLGLGVDHVERLSELRVEALPSGIALEPLKGRRQRGSESVERVGEPAHLVVGVVHDAGGEISTGHSAGSIAHPSQSGADARHDPLCPQDQGDNGEERGQPDPEECSVLRGAGTVVQPIDLDAKRERDRLPIDGIARGKKLGKLGAGLRPLTAVDQIEHGSSARRERCDLGIDTPRRSERASQPDRGERLRVVAKPADEPRELVSAGDLIRCRTVGGQIEALKDAGDDQVTDLFVGEEVSVGGRGFSDLPGEFPVAHDVEERHRSNCDGGHDSDQHEKAHAPLDSHSP